MLVQFTDEEGDIDLQLYDPLGGELESSQTATNNEHIDSFQYRMTAGGSASNIIEVERVTHHPVKICMLSFSLTDNHINRSVGSQ